MIFSNTTKKSISVISMFMVMIMGFATAFAPVSTYAAEDDGYGVGDKVKLVHDHQIRYGSGDGGYSNLMEAHGIDDSLGGAQFGLYKDGSKVATITTKADGTSNTVEVSAGTYTLKEDVCHKGYAKAAVDSGEPTRQWVLKTDEDGFCDLDFVKVKDSSMARLAGVPFKITSKTTGESHIIVTDANGYANTSSSWNLHTNNTNRGQSDEDGIWFEMDREGNKTTKVDNALGALPYDLYVLDEMPCDANKECRLLEGIEIAVTRDSATVKLGTLTDDVIEIETTAKDSESGSHFAKADEKVTIVDTVKYTGLYKNKEYVMKGILMDKETGKPLLDNESKEITAEQKFTAKSDNGTVEMSFTFDASLMQGKTTVVFESVFYNDLEVAVHADINDEGQTVTFGQPPAEHSPKTGDNLPMIPIIALLAASAAGISAALIRRKHKGDTGDSEE